MATTIEVNRSGTFEAIDYADFQIQLGTSTAVVAPTAEVTTTVRESIQPGQELRIVIDGTTRFEGVTQSAGRKDKNGQRTVEVEHDAIGLFDEFVEFSLTSPTDEQVLRAALDDGTGAGYTLNYAGTATSLNNDYETDGRSIKRVFRDMVDRTGRVWWVEPTGEVINIEPIGNGGLWNALDAQTDRISVETFDEGSVKTVRNQVKVVGTGEEAVTAKAIDSTSFNNYGRRTGDSPYQINYISTEAEAQSVADSLLQPDPLPSGEILVGQNTGSVEAPLINQTVDLTDASKDIDATGLVINEQVIRQGRARLSVGGGAGDALSRLNRSAKSRGDVTEPGSVYDSDRIADGAIAEQKLVDGSVITSKLADLAVELDKVDDGAIDTVKIRDEAIEAPKVLANTLTANEIASDTITSNEITAGTITALEIDTLDLDTNEITIGNNANEVIEFGVDTIGSTDVTTMKPSAEGLAFIGRDGNRFNEIYTRGIQYRSGSFDPTGSNESIAWGVDDGDEPSLIPGSDNSGRLGATLSGTNIGFNVVYSHNFVTLTPEPLDGVDLSKLTGHTWQKPPQYVAQQKDTDGSYKRANPNGGVDIGQMANYLLETCKAQQERIDDLESRLSDIEAQL